MSDHLTPEAVQNMLMQAVLQAVRRGNLPAGQAYHQAATPVPEHRLPATPLQVQPPAFQHAMGQVGVPARDGPTVQPTDTLPPTTVSRLSRTPQQRVMSPNMTAGFMA